MSYKNYNDFELLYMIKNNDNNSFNILFNKYLPIMKRISFDFYSCYNVYGYDLDDFQQEAFIAFSKAIDSFDESKNILFYTFVIVCIRRNMITFCKKISCEKKNISNKYFVNIDDSYVCEESNIDKYFSYKDKIENIKNIFLNLDFDDACIFELRYNGFNYREISILLDLPIRHVQFVGRKLKNILDNVC